jgi:hypothetical protein
MVYASDRTEWRSACNARVALTTAERSRVGLDTGLRGGTE